MGADRRRRVQIAAVNGGLAVVCAADTLSIMYSFAPMDIASAVEIADTWKYPPPYNFYDMTADPDDYAEFVDPTQWPAHFLKVLFEGDLVGFFSITVDNDAAEIALGMRPDLVGKGGGVTFVESCLDYARTQCGVWGRITLDVAAFNARAIRAYERAGFSVVRRYRQMTNGAEFNFLEMEYS